MLGKENAPVQNFSCRKKMGAQRKDLGGRYGFSGFHRFFCIHHRSGSFSLRPEKFPKRFSFGGGCTLFSPEKSWSSPANDNFELRHGEPHRLEHLNEIAHGLECPEIIVNAPCRGTRKHII